MERLVELGRLLDIYGEFLTERQRSLMEQSINEDYSLFEIAEREGISRQGVRDALHKAEVQLYKMESQLHVLELQQGLRSLMEKSPLELRGDIERLLTLG